MKQSRLCPNLSGVNIEWCIDLCVFHKHEGQGSVMWHSFRLVVLAALFAAVPASAWADHPGTYVFEVLRDGKPIGEHRVTVRRNGVQVEIEESSRLRVRFGPLTVFRFEHDRHEVWQDGKLVSLKGHTNKDGKSFDIEIKPNGDGLVRIINGEETTFDQTTRILNLWDPQIVDHSLFISPIEDKIYNVNIQYVGKRSTKWLTETITLFYYKMTGDEEREIWYEEAGHVVKVKFQRGGSTMDYILVDHPLFK